MTELHILGKRRHNPPVDLRPRRPSLPRHAQIRVIGLPNRQTRSQRAAPIKRGPQCRSWHYSAARARTSTSPSRACRAPVDETRAAGSPCSCLTRFGGRPPSCGRPRAEPRPRVGPVPRGMGGVGQASRRVVARRQHAGPNEWRPTTRPRATQACSARRAGCTANWNEIRSGQNGRSRADELCAASATILARADARKTLLTMPRPASWRSRSCTFSGAPI